MSFGYGVPRPTVVNNLTQYVSSFGITAPLTLAEYFNPSVTNVINVSDPRGFTWVQGEARCGSYDHQYTPNSVYPDCMAYDANYVEYDWPAPAAGTSAESTWFSATVRSISSAITSAAPPGRRWPLSAHGDMLGTDW